MASLTGTFFVHYIRHNGEEYSKGIDVCTDLDSAFRAFHTYSEYGHDNPKFPNISYTYSAITHVRRCYHQRRVEQARPGDKMMERIQTALDTRFSYTRIFESS